MVVGTKGLLTRSWLILLALTCASVLIVRLDAVSLVVTVILGLAVLKARLVVLDFMGLRGRRQTAMRRALLGWCIVLMFGAATKVIAVAMAAG